MCVALRPPAKNRTGIGNVLSRAKLWGYIDQIVAAGIARFEIEIPKLSNT